jgi:lysophospholipase L1-like esterase
VDGGNLFLPALDEEKSIMRRVLVMAAWLCLAACNGEDSPDGPAANAGPVVFMGDSITSEWDIPLPGAVNAGVSGQTSDAMLARFDDEVLRLKPSIVVILGGTNDIRRKPGSTTMNVLTMASRAKAAGAKVIVGTVPPINDWIVVAPVDPVSGNQMVADWNAELIRLAPSYGYIIANYHDAMILPDGSQNAAYFLPDALHPNAAGYEVMWKVVGPLVSP